MLSPQGVCTQLGTRIKRLRLRQNLRQQQLAEMTQGSLSSVRRLEARGQGSLVFVIRVALALQALEQFEHLFEQPVQSIAEAERAAESEHRRRARASQKPKVTLRS